MTVDGSIMQDIQRCALQFDIYPGQLRQQMVHGQESDDKFEVGDWRMIFVLLSYPEWKSGHTGLWMTLRMSSLQNLVQWKSRRCEFERKHNTSLPIACGTDKALGTAPLILPPCWDSVVGTERVGWSIINNIMSTQKKTQPTTWNQTQPPGFGHIRWGISLHVGFSEMATDSG